MQCIEFSAYFEEEGGANREEIKKLSPLQKACIDVCHFKEAGAVSSYRFKKFAE